MDRMEIERNKNNNQENTGMILDTIAEATALRVANQKKLVSPKEMQEAALRIAKAQQHRFPFEQALLREDINFIC